MLAGAFCAWLTYPAIPTRHVLSWVALWALAARCTIPVFFASGIAAFLVACTTAMESERAVIERAVTVGCAVTWLPPLIIFFSQRSPWTAVLALGIAIVLSRAILLRFAPRREIRGTRIPAFFIACCLNAGLIAAATSDWRVAALALAAAVFVLTWTLTTRAIWTYPAARAGKTRRFRVVPAFLLAVTFSAGGLTPYLAHGFGSGEGSSREDDSADAKPDGKGGNAPGVVIGDSYPGVILWPDADEKYVTLVPPLPARRDIFPTKQVESLTIPFYGAYWYFRGPGQPPKNSFVTHGDPTKLSFRSTDLRPLSMEATQNFGTSIETSCCTAIEVAIRSRDRWPGTLGLELILRNTLLSDKPSRSLGTQAVRSARWSDDVPTLGEQVIFRMPPASQFPRFDEVTLRFHLMPPRSDRSARIAIRSFKFVR